MFKVYLMIAAILVSATSARAACLDLGTATCEPATSYEITIDKVEFCKSASCASPFVVSSSSEDFDISSASAGGAVGNYADLDAVPAGVYTHIRTTIDGQITFSGPAVTTGGNNCSAQTNASTLVATAAINGALSLSANDAFNLSVDVANQKLIHDYELSNPIAISKSGSLPQVQIDFSTSDGHLCDGTTSYPGVPFVDIKVINN